MATAAELTMEEELKPLREVACRDEWRLEVLSSITFAIQLPARDGRLYWILVECDGYPANPPGVSWYDFASETKNHPAATPKGSGYIHGCGRICAPWNRYAYKRCDSQGPHDDWELSNWKSNSHTGGVKNLCAMVMKVASELKSDRYSGPTI